jgi:phosphopantothenoylcysteine decarboxylase/phosphopantothenate--cysteine ligase
MGHAIAREAARRGARVTLLLGPSQLPRLPSVETIDVVSTRDLLRAAQDAARDADLVIFAAAPSDWRPARRRRGKPKREAGEIDVRLVPTEDVARTLGRRKGGRIHVGFALQVSHGLRRAREKLHAKHLDAIVLNTPANFDRGGGPIHWVLAEGDPEPLPSSSKTATARAIVTRALRLARSVRQG